MRTIGQAKGAAKQLARARQRAAQIRQYSEAGWSKSETAASLGMTVGGVDSLLYRTFHSTAWPIDRTPASKGETE